MPVVDRMEDFNKQGNIKFIGKDEADKDGIPDLNNIVALLNEYSSDPRWLHFDIAFALREGQRKKKKKKKKVCAIGCFVLGWQEEQVFMLLIYDIYFCTTSGWGDTKKWQGRLP